MPKTKASGENDRSVKRQRRRKVIAFDLGWKTKRIDEDDLRIVQDFFSGVKVSRWCSGESYPRNKTKRENLDISLRAVETRDDHEMGRVCAINFPRVTHERSNIYNLGVSLQILTNLLYLKRLQWSIECLRSVPREIGLLKQLEELSIYSSRLESVPPEIGQLKQLEELSITSSCLPTLPKEIGNLANLRTLQLWGRKMEELPPEIGQLHNLETLNLFNTGLSTLPEEIGNLTNLRKICLDGSSIKSLPSGIGGLKNLEDLALRRTGSLTTLPAEIGGLTNLRKMHLQFSNIKSLPPSIGQLPNLRFLSLCNTEELESLPEEFGDLQNLEVLDLRSSPIRKKPLPECLGRLKRLKRLNLFSSADIEKFCEVYLPIRRSLFMLTRSCPVLGSFEIDAFNGNNCEDTSKLRKKLGKVKHAKFKALLYALAYNRFRYRTGFGINDSKCPTIPPSLWPRALISATTAYRNCYSDGEGYKRHGPLVEISIPQHDAIYRLLVDDRGSFIDAVLDRKNRTRI